MQLVSTSVILENCERLVIRSIHKTRPVKMYMASGDLRRQNYRSFINLWFASVLSPYLVLYFSFFRSFFLSFIHSFFLSFFRRFSVSLLLQLSALNLFRSYKRGVHLF